MAIKQKNVDTNYSIIGKFASASTYLADLNKSSASEGDCYWHTTNKALMVYDATASTWRAQGQAGATVGLPGAVALDPKSTLPIEIEAADNGDCSSHLLKLDNNDVTNNPDTLIIENATSGAGIAFTTTGTGNDATGTSSTWTVSKAGDSLFNSVWLKDNDLLKMGTATGGDVTVKFNDGAVGTAGNGMLIAAIGADEQLQIGDATYGIDVWFVGETATTNFMKWDIDGGADSVGALVFDNADIDLGDEDLIRLGDSQDATIGFDGTNFEILAAAADTPFAIGSATHGFDITYYFETAGWIKTDFDGDFICLSDDMDLRFGSGASSNGDFQISSSSGNLLTIGQVVSGTGTIAVGADNKGIDTTFYAETSGDYMKWDQDGGSNIGALTFVDSAIIFDQTNVDYTLKAASDALTLTATDHASAALTLGSTGTNGMNVTLQSATAGDTVAFDAGAKTLTLSDVSMVINPVTGAGNVDYTLGTSTDSLTLTATDHANASVTLGSAGTNGMNIVIQSATAGDNITFDAGSKTLTAEDCHIVVNDDTLIKFGDSGAESTIGSNGTNTNLTVASGALTIGDGGSSNYTSVSTAGNITQAGTAYIAGKVNLTAKTANYNVTAAETGVIFHTTGAAGAVTFTLPSMAVGNEGCHWKFINTVDQNMTIDSADGDDLVILNDAAGDSVSLQTASNLIGGGFEIVCTGTKYLVFPLNWADGTLAQTVTTAT